MGKEFDYTIHDIYGVVDESDSSNWGIVLSKITWGKNPPAYDLRKFNVTTLDEPEKKFSKGISFFHDEGVNRLSNLLIGMGFGDTEVLEESLAKRNSLYTRKAERQERKAAEPIITLYITHLDSEGV